MAEAGVLLLRSSSAVQGVGSFTDRHDQKRRRYGQRLCYPIFRMTRFCA